MVLTFSSMNYFVSSFQAFLINSFYELILESSKI